MRKYIPWEIIFYQAYISKFQEDYRWIFILLYPIGNSDLFRRTLLSMVSVRPNLGGSCKDTLLWNRDILLRHSFRWWSRVWCTKNHRWHKALPGHKKYPVPPPRHGGRQPGYRKWSRERNRGDNKDSKVVFVFFTDSS